jgi:hypothetical protein
MAKNRFRIFLKHKGKTKCSNKMLTFINGFYDFVFKSK